MGMQSCAAQMLESGTRGSIVTIASIAAKHPDAGPVAYTVSKAGVWMLTKKVARMLGPVGIRVNSIGPGFIKTHMTAVIDLMDESEAVAFNEMIPLGRRGEPVDIANAALFLCSDEASYFTGEILHPDGGFLRVIIIRDCGNDFFHYFSCSSVYALNSPSLQRRDIGYSSISIATMKLEALINCPF